MDALTHAKFFATTHHVIRHGQLYGGVLPYTHHLEAVEKVLIAYDFDADVNLMVAAWLHDVVEDTDVKLKEIEEIFGDDVAMLVDAVTADSNLPRAVRNPLVYPKIRKAGERAVTLKLADRIANVEKGGTMKAKYRTEFPDFKHALYDIEQADVVFMWLDLEEIFYG